MVMKKVSVIQMNMIVVFTMHMVFMIKSHSCSLCYVYNLNCRVYNIIPEVWFYKIQIEFIEVLLLWEMSIDDSNRYL